MLCRTYSNKGNMPFPTNAIDVVWTPKPAITSLLMFEGNDLSRCPKTTVHIFTPIPSKIAPVRKSDMYLCMSCMSKHYAR